MGKDRAHFITFEDWMAPRTGAENALSCMV